MSALLATESPKLSSTIVNRTIVSLLVLTKGEVGGGGLYRSDLSQVRGGCMHLNSCSTPHTSDSKDTIRCSHQVSFTAVIW